MYTIGHNAHPIEEFLSLLAQYEIKTLIDVRSNPRSRWQKQFNKRALEAQLKEVGIHYMYLGEELGGHPSDGVQYDSEGHLVYDRLLPKKVRFGLTAVIEEARVAITTLMCTEEDPLKCHRHPLLARGLIERDVIVWHIRSDGSIQDGVSLPQRKSTLQLPLLEPPGEDAMWRSPKPIRSPSLPPPYRKQEVSSQSVLLELPQHERTRHPKKPPQV